MSTILSEVMEEVMPKVTARNEFGSHSQENGNVSGNSTTFIFMVLH